MHPQDSPCFLLSAILCSNVICLLQLRKLSRERFSDLHKVIELVKGRLGISTQAQPALTAESPTCGRSAAEIKSIAARALADL